MGNYLDEMKRAEADFFDRSALHRTASDRIPIQADIRRATRFIPVSADQELIDAQMTAIVEGYYRDSFIDYLAHRERGSVLEVGCGPGWLSLELGRRGQTVDAWDLSPKAIEVAKRMLDENPYRDGFGRVEYHLGDVTQLDLGSERFDAIAGWSVFHHVPDTRAFMMRVHGALKPGGIVATLDDLPRRQREKWIERLLNWALPTYDRSYKQKLHAAYRRLKEVREEPPDFFTPMEIAAAKDVAVFDIADILHEEFEVLWDVQFGAFALTPAMRVIGPDWFRYTVARCLVILDRVCCRLGLCQGFLRIIVARKRG